MISEESAAYIFALHMREEWFNASDAMRALCMHACDWCLTVDCLHCGGGLTLADAVRAADAGFRGDDVRRARRFLATLQGN